jgi:PAS domain S-box-containing protein
LQVKFTLFRAARAKCLATLMGLVCAALSLASLSTAWLSPGNLATGSMSPGAAVCLLLASASLLAFALGQGRATVRLARSLSTMSALVAGVSLVNHVARTGIGPVEKLRMMPNSALAFLLLGGALFLLPSRRASASYASQGLAVTTIALAVFSIIASLYHTLPLFALGSLGRISLTSALGLIAAALGLLAARHDFGLPSLFTSQGPGGLLARRLLLPVLLAPIAIGWLVLEGAREGVHPASTAIALLVTAVAILQLSVGLVFAFRLERLWQSYALVLDDSRRARAALEEAEERLRLALDCGAIGVWHYDARNNLVRASPRCQAMFGIPPRSEHSNAEYRQRVHPEDRPLIDAAMQRSFDHATSGRFEVEYRVMVEPDAERWLRSTGKAFFDATGRPERMFGTVVDITDHKLARENAEAASRAKDAFLAVLGHELRNPLSPILTALELMKLRGSDVFSHERSVIERQVQHMVRLVDDLLDVSRIARGKIDLKRRHVELASVIDRSIELTSSLFEQRMHTLRVAVPARGLVVYGDEHRLVQVVSNLLTNAGKYTQQGGIIDISARASGRRALISIKDNGIGIPEHLRARVFDLFAQGPRVMERSQGGLGLGLSIVKSLVELHGGTIAAESAGAGRGSEFTVTLPLELGLELTKPAHDAPRGTGVANPSDKHAHRVLVVDDNPDTAETLAEILRFDEHEVSVAYDGPAALALARDQHFDLAFLDIGLPVMDGYELARQIRELEDGDKPVLVAVTGYGRDADRRRSRAAGFDGHLVKPVEPVQVLSIAAEPSQASLDL